MKNSRLPGSFFLNHPLKRYSFAQIAYFRMCGVDNTAVTEMLINNEEIKGLMPSERIDAIKETSEQIMNLKTAQEVIDRMRKEREAFCHGALHDRALELEDEIMPLLLARYMTSGLDQFIEIAANVFADADIEYSKKLFEEYDNIRSPYAQAEACIVFGIKKMYEAIPLLVRETERLKRIKSPDPNVELSQAPLLALYVLHDRRWL